MNIIIAYVIEWDILKVPRYISRYLQWITWLIGASYANKLQYIPLFSCSRTQLDSTVTRRQQAARESATICHRPLQLGLWPFDLESGVRITCDVGYLCASFGLPIGLSVLELGPMYATDRLKTKASLNIPPIRGGGIINVLWLFRH